MPSRNERGSKSSSETRGADADHRRSAGHEPDHLRQGATRRAARRPSPIVQSAVETVRPAADAKGVRIQVVLDPLAGPVLGDPGRLQQIFWNLLSNAVKFTQEAVASRWCWNASTRTSRSASSTPAKAFARNSSPTSSTASARPTPRRRAGTAGWAWPGHRQATRRAARRHRPRQEPRRRPRQYLHRFAARHRRSSRARHNHRASPPTGDGWRPGARGVLRQSQWSQGAGC